MSHDQRHPGGSLEERAAWDAFVREAFARAYAARGQTAAISSILDDVVVAADRMIERRRSKFPAKPR